MLELTTDPDALAAIEELIRQTRDRLSKIDEADDPSRTQNPRSLSKLRGREPGYGPRREFDCRVVGTQWSVCRRRQPL